MRTRRFRPRLARRVPRTAPIRRFPSAASIRGRRRPDGGPVGLSRRGRGSTCRQSLSRAGSTPTCWDLPTTNSPGRTHGSTRATPSGASASARQAAAASSSGSGTSARAPKRQSTASAGSVGAQSARSACQKVAWGTRLRARARLGACRSKPPRSHSGPSASSHSPVPQAASTTAPPHRHALRSQSGRDPGAVSGVVHPLEAQVNQLHRIGEAGGGAGHVAVTTESRAPGCSC